MGASLPGMADRAVLDMGEAEPGHLHRVGRAGGAGQEADACTGAERAKIPW
jgi:hypothetical protein